MAQFGSVWLTHLLITHLLTYSLAQTHGLLAFDAAKANCFKQEDRQRLLSVIEVGFGTALRFNRLVCGAFYYDYDSNTALQLDTYHDCTP